MDEQRTISVRERVIVIAAAALVVALAMARPTPEIDHYTDGVNDVPVDVSPLDGSAAAQP